MANFTITSDIMVLDSAGLTVNLLVSDGNSDFISGTPATSATILQNTTSIPYQVSTAIDHESEQDGQIVVTVISSTDTIDYLVDPAQNSATVTVWDDDGTVPVSVGVDAMDSVTEGQVIAYRIQTTGGIAVTMALQVNVKVSQVGDFIEGSFGYSEVEIQAGQSNGVLNVNTHDDIIQESSGSITATVLFGEDYRVDSTNRTKTVTVHDNADDATDIPIFSVESDSRIPVSEDQKVPFLITSNISPSEKVSIRINVDDGSR